MKLDLKKKISGLGIGLVLLTAAAIVSVVVMQKGVLGREVGKELDKFAESETSKIARDVYLMCRAHAEVVQQQVDSALEVSRDALQRTGNVTLSEETASWSVINQYDKAKTARQITLPKMLVGGQWLGQSTSFDQSVPVVDHVKDLVGGTCTIFQRMNGDGDMLRVATNVRTLDGTRAVGTYIPRTNPDGTPNPVISAVLRGETYRGRAYVVNAWYVTAYEPIWDAARQNVVGVLYVGVKQESVESLRQGIMDIVVGKTGYIYVLGGQGDQKGHYIISYRGERDGENIWDAKDSDGRLFIQSIVERGLKTGDGEVVFERYPWKNVGENTARMKLAAVTYFEPWDWVIGAGVYEDDFQDARLKVAAAMGRMTWWVVGIGLVVVVLATGLGYFVASGIAGPAKRITQVAKAMAAGDLKQRIEVQSRDEIGELAQALSDMLNGVIGRGESVIKGVSDPFFTTDTQLKITYINEAALGALGYKRDEVVGKMTCADVCRTDLCGTAQCTFKEVLSTQKPIVGRKVSVRTRQGEEVPGIVSCSVLKDLEGEAIGCMEIFRDTVRDVAAQKQVQQTSAQLSTGAEELSANAEQSRRGAEELASSATEAASAVQELNSSIVEVARNIEGQAASVTQTTAAVEQMTANIGQVAKNVESQSSAVAETTASVEELSKSVEQVAQSAKKASELSRNATQMAQNGRQAVNDTVEGMKAIAGSASKINDIIDVITGIADQTNLLALNAAIEAARAGEAGRGFAVVANEVKHLAEQSAQAAKEITGLIKDSTAKADHGVTLSNQVAEIIAQVVSAIEETAMMSQEIGSATDEQMRGMREIARAMDNLNKISHEVATAMDEQQRGAGEVAKAMDQINRVSQEVKVAMEQQSTGAQQIAKAVENVSSVAQETEAGARQALQATQNLSKEAQALDQLAGELTK
ncbi:MAG: Cache 3/Cache 2 fusion domain-containing protein [Verrucomicrobia bacterium]|nr:Cache 3/Cache 2 fusion domain-containing protein [Verrucomicrobiota bacterium]